jgi:hypothetical protein
MEDSGQTQVQSTLARRAGPPDTFIELSGPLDITGVGHVRIGRHIVAIQPATGPVINLVLREPLPNLVVAGTAVACLARPSDRQDPIPASGSIDAEAAAHLVLELRRFLQSGPGSGDEAAARIGQIRAELLTIDDSTARDAAARLTSNLELWVSPRRWRRSSDNPEGFAAQLLDSFLALQRAIVQSGGGITEAGIE